MGNDVPGLAVEEYNFAHGVAITGSAPVIPYLSASSLVDIWCTYTAKTSDRPPLFSSIDRASPNVRIVVGKIFETSIDVGLFGSVLMSRKPFEHDRNVTRQARGIKYFILRSIINLSFNY